VRQIFSGRIVVVISGVQGLFGSRGFAIASPLATIKRRSAAAHGCVATGIEPWKGDSW